MSTTDERCGEYRRREVEFVPKAGPIVGSVLAFAGWLVFILLYALEWSTTFDLFQNVIVGIASFGFAVLAVCGLLFIWYHPNGELRRK